MAESEEKKEVRTCPHCGSRVHDHKDRTEKDRKMLLNRLKRIEGQVRGLEKMVEENAYCPDVLIQASAVSSAINSFNKALLAEHRRHPQRKRRDDRRTRRSDAEADEVSGRLMKSVMERL